MKESWLLGILPIIVLAAMNFLWIQRPRFAAQGNESVHQTIPESIKHLLLKQVKMDHETIRLIALLQNRNPSIASIAHQIFKSTSSCLRIQPGK